MITVITPASFNRLDPNPPEYLYRLRNKGHWRRSGIGDTGGWYLLSKALSQVKIDLMWELGGTFLDAGCGHSPDAILATRLLGFDRAVKVDLFDLYPEEPHFLERLKEKEAPYDIRFVKADVCNMRGKVATGSISMIGCNAMIDLIEPEARILFYREAWRVLRPGGIISISWVGLAAGYGIDRRSELDQMGSLGFRRLTRGSTIVMVKEPGYDPHAF